MRWVDKGCLSVDRSSVKVDKSWLSVDKVGLKVDKKASEIHVHTIIPNDSSGLPSIHPP